MSFCKYYKEIEQISYDNGLTWANTGNYRKGGLIEENSTDCGYGYSDKRYILLTPKTKIHCDCNGDLYQNDELYFTGFGSGSTFERFDTLLGYEDDYSKLHEVYIDYTTVLLGSCTKSIGENALRETSATTFQFTNSLENIGDYAFRDNKYVETIPLPESLKTIGKYAFGGCTSLKKCQIPGSVKIIPRYCFYDCAFTEYDIQEGTISVEYRAFANCNKLSRITLPTSLESVDSEAFSGTNLSVVVFKEKIRKLGTFIFKDCPNNLTLCFLSECPPYVNTATTFGGATIEKIYVPYCSVDLYKKIFPPQEYKIEPIGGETYCSNNFSVKIYHSDSTVSEIDCDTSVSVESESLREITTSAVYGNCLTRIEDRMFSGCTSLSSVTLPYNIHYIDYGAFNGTSSLKEFNFENILEISDYAFRNSGLEGKVVLEKINKIGMYSFQDCANITEIDIGERITSIGRSAFFRTPNITKCIIRASTPPTFSDEYSLPSKAIIYVPQESISSYRVALQKISSNLASKVQPIPS